MRIGTFEFNLRELAGSMGDFGTLLPLAIGYITVCKVNPSGLLVMMGLAQIPLTATNAVIATSALVSQYWPNRHVTERQLSVNMGVMNVILPFFGGMPLCHGAGGLAGQYYFGARTGGTNIIEGSIEIALGLFLAAGIASLFVAFPRAIVGAMMLLVGIELFKFARDLRFDRGLIPVAVTVAGSVAANMAVGFVAGLAVHYLIVRSTEGAAHGKR